MAAEKRRLDGFLATWTAAVIVAHMPMTARSLDPEKLNPFGTPAPTKSDKMIELEKWKSEAKMKALAGLPVEPIKRE